jgi:hypothetical protein
MKIDGEHKPSAIAPILADRSMMLAGVRPQYRAGSGGRLKPQREQSGRCAFHN